LISSSVPFRRTASVFLVVYGHALRHSGWLVLLLAMTLVVQRGAAVTSTPVVSNAGWALCSAVVKEENNPRRPSAVVFLYMYTVYTYM
jgi:hypothetical protein